MNDPFFDLLSANSLLRGLAPDVLHELREAGTMRRYTPGSAIIRQGDPALMYHFVFCGHGKVTQITPDGHQVLIRFVRPGGSFGLASVLDGFHYMWSAHAIGETRTMAWYGEVLAQFMERYTGLSFNALRISMMRNNELEQRYQELLTDSVEQRVAQALLRLSDDVGRNTAEGILIDVPLSRADLADYAGTTLYTVSRLIQKWETAGHVRSGRERVVVRDSQSLHTLASFDQASAN
ncbi:MAG: Crp/Fnr family transcriptional regulator [Caldilineaceae bacterium]|jgi:CRP-like cAMP-binding protein